MKHRSVLIVFCVFIGCILGLLFNAVSHKTPNTSNYRKTPRTVLVVQERKKWSRLIEEIGPTNSYIELTKALSDPRDFRIAHLIAHVFGEILYQKKGVSAVSVCDERFSYGCMHGFFNKIVSEKGENILPHLFAVCTNANMVTQVNCEHGIGHAILEYFSPNRLTLALDACVPYQIFDHVGCLSGVFMEHFFPTPDGGENGQSEARPFDVSHPYDICTQIPLAYQAACYYHLSQWWLIYFPDNFSRLGTLCGESPRGITRDSCYLGLGHMTAINAAFSTDIIRTYCSDMPDETSGLLCRAGAYWQHSVMPAHALSAPNICKDQNGLNQQLCIKRANLLDPKQYTFDQKAL